MMNRYPRHQLVAILALLVLGTTGLAFLITIHVASRNTAEQAVLLSLAGEWQACEIPADTSSSALFSFLPHCQWKTVRVPGIAASTSSKSARAIFVFRKYFQAPAKCTEPSQSCSFIAGEIRDSGEAFLNRTRIGQHGNYPNEARYSSLYPVVFHLSGLNAKRSNELLFFVTSNQLHATGITRLPLGVAQTNQIHPTFEFLLSERVLLPLLSAMGCIMFALWALTLIARSKTRDRMAEAFVFFNVISILYLISLSRIPRQFLDITNATSLNFTLRMAFDLSLYSLVLILYGAHETALKHIRFLYFTGLAILGGTILSHSAGILEPSRQSLYQIVRILSPLWVIPTLLGFILGILRSKKDTRAVPLAVVFLLFTLMNISDVYSYHGFVNERYFARFLPLLIAIPIGHFIWNQNDKKQQNLAVNAKLGDMLSRVAHDIRSPIMTLNVLRQRSKNLSTEEMELIDLAVSRIRDIADSTLEERKTLYQQERTRPDAVNVIVALQELIKEKRAELSNRNDIRLVLICPQNISEIFCTVDASKFKRMISNLINNAVEAIVEAGTVKISVEIKNKDLELNITDTGKGFSPRLLALIRSGHPLPVSKKGNGIGLSSAMDLTKSWNGHFAIDSTQGYGTRILIRLPVVVSS